MQYQHQRVYQKLLFLGELYELLSHQPADSCEDVGSCWKEHDEVVHVPMSIWTTHRLPAQHGIIASSKESVARCFRRPLTSSCKYGTIRSGCSRSPICALRGDSPSADQRNSGKRNRIHHLHCGYIPWNIWRYGRTAQQQCQAYTNRRWLESLKLLFLQFRETNGRLENGNLGMKF